MAGKLVRVILIAGLLVLISSCASTKQLVIDESVPLERSAVVTFVSKQLGWFNIQEYNGISIYANVYPKDWVSSNDSVILTVPAGETSIGFHLYFTFSNQQSSTTYELKNQNLTWNYEAGKRYEIVGTVHSLGFLKPHELKCQIYDVTDKKNRQMLREWVLANTSDFR